MEQETFFNILTGHYGEILETHAMWQCIASLGIKPFKDGNQWCYLYGDNIQEGICGFGSTIYEAAWDFYSNIKTEEARQAKPEFFDTMAFQKGVKEGVDVDKFMDEIRGREKTVTDCHDLTEAAAFEYERTRNDLDARSDNEVARRAFKAGAEWMKTKMIKEDAK